MLAPARVKLNHWPFPAIGGEERPVVLNKASGRIGTGFTPATFISSWTVLRGASVRFACHHGRRGGSRIDVETKAAAHCRTAAVSTDPTTEPIG